MADSPKDIVIEVEESIKKEEQLKRTLNIKKLEKLSEDNLKLVKKLKFVLNITLFFSIICLLLGSFFIFLKVRNAGNPYTIKIVASSMFGTLGVGTLLTSLIRCINNCGNNNVEMGSDIVSSSEFQVDIGIVELSLSNYKGRGTNEENDPVFQTMDSVKERNKKLHDTGYIHNVCLIVGSIVIIALTICSISTLIDTKFMDEKRYIPISYVADVIIIGGGVLAFLGLSLDICVKKVKHKNKPEMRVLKEDIRLFNIYDLMRLALDDEERGNVERCLHVRNAGNPYTIKIVASSMFGTLGVGTLLTSLIRCINNCGNNNVEMGSDIVSSSEFQVDIGIVELSLSNYKGRGTNEENDPVFQTMDSVKERNKKLHDTGYIHNVCLIVGSIVIIALTICSISTLIDTKFMDEKRYIPISYVADVIIIGGGVLAFLGLSLDICVKKVKHKNKPEMRVLKEDIRLFNIYDLMRLALDDEERGNVERCLHGLKPNEI
ncbi:20705_t:CDS:2 [Funneliformis geosporum]|nr:20705_t:CDS:2 [Funneliformis geosporum]